jgi:hypothetical protein
MPFEFLRTHKTAVKAIFNITNGLPKPAVKPLALDMGIHTKRAAL